LKILLADDEEDSRSTVAEFFAKPAMRFRKQKMEQRP